MLCLTFQLLKHIEQGKDIYMAKALEEEDVLRRRPLLVREAHQVQILGSSGRTPKG